jgi:hypothetical protein
MKKPPPQIDNANVLFWAWSGSTPFGLIKSTDGLIAIEIYGLAICQYADSDEVYRFSCDNNWETQQDYPYSSIKEAIDELPEQYKNVKAKWIKFD